MTIQRIPIIDPEKERNDQSWLNLLTSNISPDECYRRIFIWLIKIGKDRGECEYQRMLTTYQGEYLEKRKNLYQIFKHLMKVLPEPKFTNSNDMDYVFIQCFGRCLYWASDCEDAHGIRIQHYAEYALQQKYHSEDYFKIARNNANESNLC